MPRKGKKKGSARAPRKGGRGQRSDNRELSNGGAAFSSNNARFTIPRYRRIDCRGTLPDELHINLVYAQRLLFTATTGATSSNIFWGNGLYDPDATGSGAQPAWFDYFAGMYRLLHVKACRLRAQFKSNSASVVSAVTVTPGTSSGAAALTDQLTNPYSQTTLLTLNTPTWTIDARMSTSDMLGASWSAIQGNESAASTASTNPISPQDWYWVIRTQAEDGASTALTFGDFVLTYEVVCHGRQTSDVDLAADRKRVQVVDDGVQTAWFTKHAGAPPVSDKKLSLPPPSHRSGVKSGTARVTKQDASGDIKIANLDEEDEDEAIYADFQRWKRATQGGWPAVTPPPTQKAANTSHGPASATTAALSEKTSRG